MTPQVGRYPSLLHRWPCDRWPPKRVDRRPPGVRRPPPGVWRRRAVGDRPAGRVPAGRTAGRPQLVPRDGARASPPAGRRAARLVAGGGRHAVPRRGGPRGRDGEDGARHVAVLPRRVGTATGAATRYLLLSHII